MAQITYTIQAKRDTAANWTANNPTLAEGEFGFETDTKKLKIGDGNTLAETSLADAIPSTNLEPDSVILIRFFRDSAHANDTFPDAVMGMFGDIHYQTSTISTLNKTPNFYA